MSVRMDTGILSSLLPTAETPRLRHSSSQCRQRARIYPISRSRTSRCAMRRTVKNDRVVLVTLSSFVGRFQNGISKSLSWAVLEFIGFACLVPLHIHISLHLASSCSAQRMALRTLSRRSRYDRSAPLTGSLRSPSRTIFGGNLFTPAR